MQVVVVNYHSCKVFDFGSPSCVRIVAFLKLRSVIPKRVSSSKQSSASTLHVLPKSLDGSLRLCKTLSLAQYRYGPPDLLPFLVHESWRTVLPPHLADQSWWRILHFDTASLLYHTGRHYAPIWRAVHRIESRLDRTRQVRLPYDPWFVGRSDSATCRLNSPPRLVQPPWLFQIWVAGLVMFQQNAK